MVQFPELFYYHFCLADFSLYKEVVICSISPWGMGMNRVFRLTLWRGFRLTYAWVGFPFTIALEPSGVEGWKKACGIKTIMVTICLYFQNMSCLFYLERLLNTENNSKWDWLTDWPKRFITRSFITISISVLCSVP